MRVNIQSEDARPFVIALLFVHQSTSNKRFHEGIQLDQVLEDNNVDDNKIKNNNKENFRFFEHLILTNYIMDRVRTIFLLIRLKGKSLVGF